MTPTQIELRLDFPMTANEREAIRLALGILRSGTDYADFLNSWLQDYGPQLLSSNPPPPLLDRTSPNEELELLIEDMPQFIQ